MVSLMRRRREMMQAASGSGSRLPSGYTEVSYIQSSGTQYIISNIIPLNTKTEMNFQFLHADNSTEEQLCSRYDSNNRRYYTLWKSSSNKFVISTRSNTTVWTSDADENRHTVIYNESGGKAYFDGVEVATGQQFTPSSSSRPLGIFCRNSSSVEKPASAKLYSLKFTNNQNSEVIGEFIPCVRTSDSKVGLYDLVSEAFYGSAGADDFVAGPAV